MASPKKRVNPLFVALAVVLVAVVVAVGVVFPAAQQNLGSANRCILHLPV